MLTTCKNELDPSDESECSSIEILRALTEHLKAPPQKRRQSQALSVTFQQDQPAEEEDDDDIDDMYFSAVSFILCLFNLPYRIKFRIFFYYLR